MERLIVDTDVLIDATRNNPQALAFFEQHKYAIAFSVVTLTELHSGFRDKNEEARVTAFCHFFDRYAVDEEIAVLAGRFRKQYAKVDATGVADCLIAATAVLNNATLVTLNKKHYPMLNNVHIPYKKS